MCASCGPIETSALCKSGSLKIFQEARSFGSSVFLSGRMFDVSDIVRLLEAAESQEAA